MNIGLRKFQQSDECLLANWARKINAPQYMSHIRPAISESFIENRNSKLAWYIIQKDGMDIGTVWVENLNKEPDTIKLGILLGDEQEFGKGVGKQAISLAIESTRKVIEFNKVILHVRSSNLRAIRCYLACGFAIVAEYDNTNAKGQSIRAFRMEKLLL